MEETRPVSRRKRLLGTALAVLAAFLLRGVLAELAIQLLAAAVLMLLALPLCRVLEKRVPAGWAAALSLLMLLVLAVLALMLLVPPLFRQLQQLTGALPALVDTLNGHWLRLTGSLAERGVDAAPLREGLLRQMSDQAGSLIGRAAAAVTGFLSGLGRVLPAPLMAFYLLRDRRIFGLWAWLAVPPRFRLQCMRSFRVIRGELRAYCRGQLLLSAFVGTLTALALLLTGTPAWLLLGALMGVMELIPYVGPFIAGAPAVLLSLQNGLPRALWTLAAILAVQQAEATFLSPRLLGSAARLHPLAVLLLVSAAGILAGPVGMLLVIPGTIALRGVWRGWQRVPQGAQRVRQEGNQG